VLRLTFDDINVEPISRARLRFLPRLNGGKILIIGNHDPYFKRLTNPSNSKTYHDAYVEGRGVHNKVIVAGAVEVRTKVAKSSKRTIYAGRLRLQVLKDRSAKALETFVVENVELQSQIITDGWRGPPMSG